MRPDSSRFTFRHILTALGAYIVLTAGSCLALAVQEGHSNFSLTTDKYGLPCVVRLSKVDAQGELKLGLKDAHRKKAL